MTLVEKLTDDDIASVLWCMDAVNNLKQLRLYWCVNLIGHGLSQTTKCKPPSFLMISLSRTSFGGFWGFLKNPPDTWTQMYCRRGDIPSDKASALWYFFRPLPCSLSTN
jgi:hypothetical protein